MRVGICTLGCKVNSYESEYFIEQLVRSGYTISSFDDVCDVYIINTCSVTNTSSVKSRKMIRRCKRLNKNACVVATGCFIESDLSYQDDDIDIYLGNNLKSELISLLDLYFTKKEVIRKFDKEKNKFDNMFIKNMNNRSRAFVKIQDGCENFCSYCIIPYVRGKCRSKDFDTVVEEVKTLVKEGYKEVVLTGIHTGNYMEDDGISFARLLRVLVTIKGLERLRISSIEVTELTVEVLDIIKNSSVIVPHFHIPLQAGSNNVLVKMNRKYDLDFYKNKIKDLKKIKNDLAITTDIIVGFPEEADSDFLETIKTARELGFMKIHVFPFSLRSGTKAEELMPVKDSIKKERARTLIKVSKELEKEYLEKYINTKQKVLIEEVKNEYSIGHTPNFMKVKILGSYQINNIIEVEITKVLNGICFGKVVN